jgi:hypothetical protein
VFGVGSFAALAAMALETLPKLLAFARSFLRDRALRNLFKMT